MYNWSVDEKQFTSITEVVSFLKGRPEVASVRQLKNKDRFGNTIILTKLIAGLRPIEKFMLSHILSDRVMMELRVSICENKQEWLFE